MSEDQFTVHTVSHLEPSRFPGKMTQAEAMIVARVASRGSEDFPPTIHVVRSGQGTIDEEIVAFFYDGVKFTSELEDEDEDEDEYEEED